jgi:hypothetical protein
MSAPITFAVAQSDAVDTRDATDLVIRDLTEKLGDIKPGALIVYAALDHEHTLLLDALAERWPAAVIVGGSADGAFCSGRGFCEDPVTLIALAGEGLRFRAGVGRNLTQNTTAATHEALDQVLDGEAPALCFISPDGLRGNIDDSLAALRARLGDRVPVLGGTTGDHWEFKDDVQFMGRAVLRDAIVVLGVWGDIRVASGVVSGWSPVGPVMTVTKVQGQEIQEIDGRPAFKVFEENFGELVRSAFGEYPLAVFPDGIAESEYFLRAVYKVNEAEGSVVLAANIPVGSTVRLTNIVRDRIVEGARESARQALARSDFTAAGALVISCAARKWMLGNGIQDEYVSIRSALGDAVPFAGFYSFGEIAPLGGTVRFHNETCVTAVIGY